MNTPSRIFTRERRSDDVGDTALRAQLSSAFVGPPRTVVSCLAGENAETAQLIKLGLKELAK